VRGMPDARPGRGVPAAQWLIGSRRIS